MVAARQPLLLDVRFVVEVGEEYDVGDGVREESVRVRRRKTTVHVQHQTRVTDDRDELDLQKKEQAT